MNPRSRALVVGILISTMAAAAPAADSVRSLVDGAVLQEMRWPDVSDYKVHLDNFYRSRNDALAWTRDGKPTPQAMALTRVFAAADAKGVNAADYDGDRWRARMEAILKQPSEEALARFDVEMTASLMRYISDLRIGRINPYRVDFLLDVSAKKYDLPKLLTSLVGVADIADALEAVEPQYDGYRRLRGALQRYRALAAEPETVAFPRVAKTVAPGGEWEAVPQLAAFLRRVGDFDGSVTGTRYDGALVEGVKRFQLRHGLEGDGRIGPATIDALNVPLAFRVDQIRWSMERWRWVPAEITVPPIVVNIPEFKLRAFSTDQHAELIMNVVVGKSFKTETPVFSDTLTTIVFRPYWNVPASIQRNELGPKIARDPGYLSRNNYEMVGGRIRQKPGPTNALGNVKFLFPNSMNIYMHDTPSRGAFAQSRRDFSHGCIRLGNPAALAEWVLKGEGNWNAETIAEAMTKGPTDRHIKVPRPTPILIVYATAVAPEDGRVYFFRDIYGHDTTLADALAGGYPYED